jgi:hypothetical protein
MDLRKPSEREDLIENGKKKVVVMKDPRRSNEME